jgi:hypothetical protein
MPSTMLLNSSGGAAARPRHLLDLTLYPLQILFELRNIRLKRREVRRLRPRERGQYRRNLTTAP